MKPRPSDLPQLWFENWAGTEQGPRAALTRLAQSEALRSRGTLTYRTAAPEWRFQAVARRFLAGTKTILTCLPKTAAIRLSMERE